MRRSGPSYRPAIAPSRVSNLVNNRPMPETSSARATTPSEPASTTAASGSARSGATADSSVAMATLSRNVASVRSITRCRWPSAIRTAISVSSCDAESRSSSPSTISTAPRCESRSLLTTCGVGLSNPEFGKGVS